MFVARTVVSALLVSSTLALVSLTSALAQSINKQCNDEWLAEKKHPVKWAEYMKDCRTRMQPAATAPGLAAPPPSPPASSATPPGGTGTGATKVSRPMSRRERQIQCEAEWRSNDRQLIAQTPGLSWPKFWSDCDKRLKAEAKH